MKLFLVVLLSIYLSINFNSTALAEVVYSLNCDKLSSIRVDNSHGWSLRIRLTLKESEKFHTLTKNNIGNAIRITADRSTLARVQVKEPVTGGNMAITTKSRKQAEEYANLICREKLLRDTPDRKKQEEAYNNFFLNRTGPPAYLYDLGCGNVDRLEILRNPRKGDFFYSLIVFLNARGCEDFARFEAGSPKRYYEIGDQVRHIKIIRMAVNGTEIQSHMPYWDSHGHYGAVLHFQTPEAAFEAARTICPGKVPPAMNTEGFTTPPATCRE